MQVNDLIETAITDDEEQAAMVCLDAILDKNANPLVNLLFH